LGKESKIEWTDATHNFWSGCTKVSPGCAQCYAERIVQWHGGDFSIVKRASEKKFYEPLSWQGHRMIFTCSMSDFFHVRADEWRDEAWDVIRRTPAHTWQILTKRPERIRDCLPSDWENGYPNVWLGTSIEMQQYIGRVRELTSVPARVHFLSVEPLIGRVDFQSEFESLRRTIYHERPIMLNHIEWVIVGGESDYHHPRAMNLDWAKLVRDQCDEMNIPFFLKQLGGRSKCACHDAWGCRELDGRTYDAMPKMIA